MHDSIQSAIATANSNDLINLSRELRGVLEQAAKEIGGVFTNVSRSESAVVATIPLTIEGKRRYLASRIAEAMRKALPEPEPK